MSPLNIGFVSTRFHGTDGVSLEAAKWAEVLERMGHRCFWMAGQLDTPASASMQVPEAFFDHPPVAALQERLFGRHQRERSDTDEIMRQKERLKDALYEFEGRFGLDLLIPQNILAIPMHVPLGLAATEYFAETRLPGIAHHHDFHWERDRFSIAAVSDYLEMAFPPKFRRAFCHVVINSQAQVELARRGGLTSRLIPNVFDFAKPPVVDAYGADFRSELGIPEEATMILQPTRIVSRKGIEHSIELAHRLRQRGRLPYLVISHAAGDEGHGYLETLVERARELDVRLVMAGDRIDKWRVPTVEGRKTYRLWDAYPHADLVTFPSLYEGFGNALLEAMYFRKPLLVNRYSIYVRDIAPCGFRVVEMDGVLTRGAVDEIELLLGEAGLREEWTEHNYQLCRRHYSHELLERHLGDILVELFGT